MTVGAILIIGCLFFIFIFLVILLLLNDRAISAIPAIRAAAPDIGIIGLSPVNANTCITPAGAVIPATVRIGVVVAVSVGVEGTIGTGVLS